MEKTVASRVSFGETILKLGHKNLDIVLLESDLGKSTYSSLFGAQFPSRYFQMGIAEANMIGTASGLALSGKIPFICSFAVFVTGRFDIIRMSISYNAANVKIIGTHAGIAIGEDGYSQQALEDISLMRSLSNMSIIQPCDHFETEGAIEYAVKHKGPMFIRLTRQKLEPIHSEGYEFKYGQGEVLREGEDLTFFATGAVLYNTLECAKVLWEEGVSAQVVNIHTIKPLDKELILGCARKTGYFITVEDHSIIGGLGSAISELLVENYPIPLKRIGIQDCFGESGSLKELYEKFKLDIGGIYETTKAFLRERIKKSGL